MSDCDAILLFKQVRSARMPDQQGTDVMSSLVDLPDIVGFFSYSRHDDTHSQAALSKLRRRIDAELRLQLGHDIKLWQDVDAIAAGALWESKIREGINQSVFFIPIVTPSAIRSQHCKIEFDLFLERESALGRDDLVFPILYIRVPELDTDQWRQDPVLGVIGKRQYLDWRRFRLQQEITGEAAELIERFCNNIYTALHKRQTPRPTMGSEPLKQMLAASEPRLKASRPGPSPEQRVGRPQPGSQIPTEELDSHRITITAPDLTQPLASPIVFSGTHEKPLPTGTELWLFTVGDSDGETAYWPQEAAIGYPDWSLEYRPKAPKTGDRRTLQLYLVGRDGQCLISYFKRANKQLTMGTERGWIGITRRTSDMDPAGPQFRITLKSSEESDKQTLVTALNDPKWRDARSIQVLAKNIGQSEEATRRLLTELGARRVRMEDGREGWTLKN